MTDQPDWSAIRERIDQLRAQAKSWHIDHPDAADFMPAFAGAADEIVEDAEQISHDCCEAAHQLIDEILIELGYMEPAERQT